jgi:hypothetical protein
MLLKGILLGASFGFVSLFLFSRLATAFTHGRPAIVPLGSFATSFFGGIAIGAGIVAALVFSFLFYMQHTVRAV